MKPTRIVEEPKKVKNRLVFVCDDGKTYTKKTLSAAVGLSPDTFYTRLQKLGWDHPDILADTHLRNGGWLGKDRKFTKAKGDLSHLSCRSRKQKLSSIPGPTKFDRRYGGV